MITSLLQNIGMSDNEARLYLAAIEEGVASAQSIARRAKMKRTTAYSVLTALVQKGFMHTTKAGSKTRYAALAPRQIAERIQEYHQEFLAQLPSLEAIYNKRQTKPKVTFFETPDSVQRLFHDMLTRDTTHILSLHSERFLSLPLDFINGFFREKAKRGILSRRVTPKTSRWMYHQSRDKAELAETVMLPTDLFHPGVDIFLSQQKLIFFFADDMMALVIEHEALSTALRQVYELAWHQAKAIARD